jgi:acyl carrier protein
MSAGEYLDQARFLVAGALGLALDNVGVDARLHRLINWDSLGQVSIVLAIEEMLGIEIVDESTFISLTSVHGIATYIHSLRGTDEGKD